MKVEKPVCCCVLIKVDELNEKEGLLYLPENVRKRQQMAHDKGTLMEVGGNCFEDPAWKGVIPKIGDRVIFDKYAGTLLEKPTPGTNIVEQFRLCNDGDIKAVIVEE